MSARALFLAVLAAALSACAYNPPAGGSPLITAPYGTIDTTHGAVGAQTSPR
jgi:hypothetical protein